MLRVRSIALATAISRLLAAPARAQDQTFTTTSIPANAAPFALAAGDFDGDGDRDLAVTNRVSGPQTNDGNGNIEPGETDPDFVTLLRGNGTGGFASDVTDVVGNRPIALTAADFDGDGDDDAATANFGSDDVTLLRGGSGGLTPYATVTVGNGPHGIAAGDADGDGDTDLVVGHQNVTGGDSLLTLRNDGGGTFSAGPVTPAGCAPALGVADVAVARWDAGPTLDVVHVCAAKGLNVALGGGSGAFTPLTLAAAQVAGDVELADLNGDGRLDAVEPGGGGSSFRRSLQGEGGQLGPAASVAGPAVSGGGHVRAATGDLDGDGNADVVMSTPADEEIFVARGDGNGGFVEGPTAGQAGRTYSVKDAADVLVADFDDDALSDIAVSQTGGSVAILRNVTAGRVRARTLSATERAARTATLHGEYAGPDAGTPLTHQFEYRVAGTDGPVFQTAVAGPASASSLVPTSAAVSGLSPDTEYEYRLRVIRSGGGSTFGAWRSFRTTAQPVQTPPPPTPEPLTTTITTTRTITVPAAVAPLPARPTVVGSGRIGAPLRCVTGPPPAGAAVVLTWLRNGRPIARAGGDRYVLVRADAGTALQCAATATSAAGAGTAESAPVVVAATCAVPSVRNLPLSGARGRLGSAGCSTGRVRRARSRRVRRGRVVSQSRAAGQRVALGTKVDLVISRGR